MGIHVPASAGWSPRDGSTAWGARLALPGLRPIQSLYPHQHLQEVITEGHKKFAPGRRITGARANGLSRPIRG